MQRVAQIFKLYRPVSQGAVTLAVRTGRSNGSPDRSCDRNFSVSNSGV